MAPHSSTLAWKIPWTEEPGQAVVHGLAKSRTRLSDFTFSFHLHALEKEMATHSSFLAWRIPGRGSLMGCRLWGHTESDTNEVTQQQQQQHPFIYLLEIIIYTKNICLAWHLVPVCVLIAHSCLTLRDSMDCNLSGSSVHEILQARILEWIAISFSRGSSLPRDQTWVSCIAGRCFTI